MEKATGNSPGSAEALVERTLLANGTFDALAFHPDGKRWAGLKEGRLSIWDGSRGGGESGPVACDDLRFSSDGRLLLCGAEAFDADSGKVRASPPFEKALSESLGRHVTDFELRSASFSPDGGTLLVAATWNEEDSRGRGIAPDRLVLVDGRTRSLLGELWRPREVELGRGALSARWAAIVGDGIVHLKDRSGSGPPEALGRMEGRISALTISPDETLVIAVDARAIHAWRTGDRKQMGRIPISDGRTSIAWGPGFLVTGDERGIDLRRPVDLASRLRADGVGIVRAVSVDRAGVHLLVAVGGDSPSVVRFRIGTSER